jgi:nucleoside-diphosphate-sugar epimerase
MVLVAGSTGVLGFEICRRLRERGQSVRALTRASSAPERVGALRALGCELVTGRPEGSGFAGSGVRGRGCHHLHGQCHRHRQGGDSFSATDGAGNIDLVDAAVAARARQFIFISFDPNGMPDAPLVAAKRDVDEHLTRAGSRTRFSTRRSSCRAGSVRGSSPTRWRERPRCMEGVMSGSDTWRSPTSPRWRCSASTIPRRETR